MASFALIVLLSAICQFVASQLRYPLTVEPQNLNRDVELKSGARFLSLRETEAKQVADMMHQKSVSILIEFLQTENNKGTLISVYGGVSKVFELFSEGLRGELRAYWRRESSLANLNIQNVELDDEQWHKVIFDLHGDRMRLTIDCKDIGVSGDYPEIDFRLLNKSRPMVWVSQRTSSQSLLMGRLREFKVRSHSFYDERCSQRSIARVIPIIGVAMPDQPPTEHIDELRNKVKKLEHEISKWRPQAMQPDVHRTDTGVNKATSTGEPDASKGVCPNCYEYLRFRVNYLDEEFKKWRDSVQKLEASLKKAILVQRGCMVNNTYYDDGDTWQSNCTQCTCNLGKQLCHPVGCKMLECTKPIKVPGQCCPVCGSQCFYQQNVYDHGQVFWPKQCIRCECRNGDTNCAFQKTQCPQLTCGVDKQHTPENQCCPVCPNEHFCSTMPCNANATCTNLQHGRECKCQSGFFGDGVEHCFDVDECQTPTNETASPCGPGSRCINTFGGFHCECLPGYVKMNNRTCFDTIGTT